MNKLKGICFLLFFFGAGFVGSIIIILRKYDNNEALDVLKQLCKKTLNLGKIKVEVDGEEHLSIKDGYVVVYNETSWPDVVALQAVLFNDYVDHAAAASEYGLIPFMKKACKMAGIALIPRGDRSGVDQVLNELIHSLKAGRRVAFGGEGRLSGIDGVLRFKVGSALLAIRSGKPLIPVAFHGGQKLMPLKSMCLKPGTIRIRFGPPILTKGLTEDNSRKLADEAQLAVSKLYEELSHKKS